MHLLGIMPCPSIKWANVDTHFGISNLNSKKYENKNKLQKKENLRKIK